MVSDNQNQRIGEPELSTNYALQDLRHIIEKSINEISPKYEVLGIRIDYLITNIRRSYKQFEPGIIVDEIKNMTQEGLIKETYYLDGGLYYKQIK